MHPLLRAAGQGHADGPADGGPVPFQLGQVEAAGRGEEARKGKDEIKIILYFEQSLALKHFFMMSELFFSETNLKEKIEMEKKEKEEEAGNKNEN